MKKWVSGILLCAAAVSLAACGNKNASSGEGTEKAAAYRWRRSVSNVFLSVRSGSE